MNHAELVDSLRAAGCVFPEEEAAEIERVAAPDLAEVVAARGSGVPLEHALGVVRFAGLDLAIGPRVFVPRQRTDVLVTDAINARPDARVVVDLGCGCGALAAALARGLPAADVRAVESDPDALVWAERNGHRFGFGVSAGSWWDGLPDSVIGQVDLAVAYLPHVPEDELEHLPRDLREHEPLRTVLGGPDGLDPLRAVLADLDHALAPGGVLVTLLSEAQRAVAVACVGARPVVCTSYDDDLVLQVGRLQDGR